MTPDQYNSLYTLWNKFVLQISNFHPVLSTYAQNHTDEISLQKVTKLLQQHVLLEEKIRYYEPNIAQNFDITSSKMSEIHTWILNHFEQCFHDIAITFPSM